MGACCGIVSEMGFHNRCNALQTLYQIFILPLPNYWHILCYEKVAEVMPVERMDAMANTVKYSGICETCDHDKACMLKRIPQLEVIECEHFCTHPVVNNLSVVPADASPADPAESSQGEK